MEITAYLAGALQRFTEFGGYHPVAEEQISPVVGWWTDSLLEREEGGLTTLVALVSAREDRPHDVLRDALVQRAREISRERGGETLVLLLLVSAGPVPRFRYDEWQALKAQEYPVRLVPWVVDLERGRLFQHEGPPFELDPDLALLAAPEPRSGDAHLPEHVTPPRTPSRGQRWREGLRETPATVLLLAVIAAIWVAMAVSAGSVAATGEDTGLLIQWGGAGRPFFMMDREYWRLLSAVFVHIGPWHLFLNGLSLWSVGRVVEILFGPLKMLYLFVTAGVAGSALSAVLGPPIVLSAGASGAIFGLLGAVIWFRISSPVGWRIAWKPLAITLGLNLGLGLAMYKYVDNWNHVGGLLGGFVAAAAVGVPALDGMAQPRFRLPRPMRVVAGALLAVAVVVTVAGMVRLPGPSQDLADALHGLEEGRFAQAEPVLRRAAQLQPDEPFLHFRLAQIYLISGRCADARREVRLVRALDPQFENLPALEMAIQRCRP